MNSKAPGKNLGTHKLTDTSRSSQMEEKELLIA